jgi:3-oxoacyl-[acyl-carrier-protein] synthase II
MSSQANEPIVLTGCGWVTPLATGSIREVFAAARQARAEPEQTHGYWAVSDELAHGYPDLSSELNRDRGARLTGIALINARRDASMQTALFAPERIGLVLGCALAGQLGMIGFANEVRQQGPSFVSPIHFPQTVGNYIAGALSRAFDIRGPNLTVASGTASGLDALAEGWALLASGDADVVFAGGTDRLSADLVKGLAKPGVVLSEGACLFALERADSAAARGVSPLAVVRRSFRTRVNEALSISPHEAIVSCAACGYPGAVFVEHWVGQCFGASGAAALAAAIGAADGEEVPVLNETDPVAISVQPVAVGRHTREDDGLRAVVRANADGCHATTIELSVQPPGPASER